MSNQPPISTFLGIAAGLVLASNGFATIINVPGDHATIQLGINAAVNGDEIIVAPGTYLEAIDFLGKAITVRSSGGAAVTTIDGGGVELHVVQCVLGEGSATVLDGFTITGGNATGGFPDNAGGGMYNDSSSPTVTNCTFSGNMATFGGGMYNDSSSPTVTNCTFIGNTATSSGGGMLNDNGSSPTVTNCRFIGNTATSLFGGGMANVTNSNPTVINCTFTGNQASVGGGGGMDNDASSPSVVNCTFSGNLAGPGGGIYNIGLSNTPTVTNCIVWGNTTGQIFDAGGAVSTVSFTDVQGGLLLGMVDGGGNIDLHPLFVDADGADNVVGTADDDLRLPSGSPCIDAADNTAVPVGITTDLDGKPRFVDDPNTTDTGNGTAPIVDMGAYELQPPCPADINGDGSVNVLDLVELLLAFGTTCP